MEDNEQKQEPQFITDAAKAEAMLATWEKLLSYSGAKVQQAIKVLGDITADALGYHEKSLNRKAIKQRVSQIASRHKQSVKLALKDSLKDTGQVPNPLFLVGDKPFADIIAARVFGEVKSLCHAYLAETRLERVPLASNVDANGNALPPIAIDLSKVNGITDEWNKRLDNAYNAHTPSLKVGKQAPKKVVKATWTMPEVK